MPTIIPQNLKSQFIFLAAFFARPVFAATTDDDLRTAIAKLDAAKVYGIFDTLTTWLFWAGTVIAIIMLGIAAILFARSQGDESKITDAKNTVRWTVAGLVLILLAKGMVMLLGSFFS